MEDAVDISTLSPIPQDPARTPFKTVNDLEERVQVQAPRDLCICIANP